MNDNGKNARELEHINSMIFKDQKAAVNQFAKDSGLVSFSAGLRKVIDEWIKGQAAKAGVEVSP